MGKMSILQSSVQADASCVVFCRSQANLLLRNINPKYEASLLKVYDCEGEVYFIWADVNPKNEETAFITVFANEEDIIPAIEDAKPIKVGEAFNHEDNYYIMTQNMSDDLVIRRLSVLSDEKMVRQILADDVDFKDIESVSLSKLFAIGQGKQFLTLSWAIACSDGSITYLPILDKDWTLFDEYCIGSLLKEPAKSGLPIKMHGKYYTPVCDVLGKWHIECSKELKLVPMYR